MVAIVEPPPPPAGDSAPPPANHFMLINPVTQKAVMLQGDVAEYLTGGGNPGVRPASKAAIKGLRTVEAGEVQKEENCPVCLDEHGVEMEVKEMPARCAGLRCRRRRRMRCRSRKDQQRMQCQSRKDQQRVRCQSRKDRQQWRQEAVAECFITTELSVFRSRKVGRLRGPMYGGEEI